MKDGSGELKFTSTHSDGSPFGSNITSTTSIPTGVWVQLVTVHQGTTVTLYINGQEAGSGSTGKTIGAANSNTFEVIGLGGAFTGLVDDLRLYDRALSSSEHRIESGADQFAAANEHQDHPLERRLPPRQRISPQVEADAPTSQITAFDRQRGQPVR